MSIEKALTQGIVFKKASAEDESKGKKPTLSQYLKGTHASGSAKKKAEYKLKRALRNQKRSK